MDKTLYFCPTCSTSERGYPAISPYSERQCPICGSANLQLEDRHHRFLRLAMRRGQVVASDLEKLAKLSHRAYEYTDDDIDRLFDHIRASVDEAEQAFRKSPKRKLHL